jgi:glucoamylase
MKSVLFLLLLVNMSTAYSFTRFQFKKSLDTVIENSTMPDVQPGMVVASPSRSNPNYYFDWVRDTALTMRSLIDYYELTKNPKIKKMILTWIQAETRRQNMPSLSGLGEPKYNIDGSGFTGPWGRPQNDGPALRAIAMIKFARLLLDSGETDYVLKYLYHGVLPADSVIKKDLEYTAHHWQEPSFDLWEEEKGMHFYTLLAQHTALQEGAKLAEKLSDSGAADFYKTQSSKVAQKLKTFLNSSIGIKVTTSKVASLGYKDSGIDVAPLLALLHTYPYQTLFPLNHPSVKKYITTLKDTFQNLYQINKSFPDLGVAIGRYPEDKYDGYGTNGVGNPWFLSTLALGEYYCLTKNKDSQKQLERTLFHSDHRGGLSEQMNHQTGYMQGARDLTWSHNAFITAVLRCKLPH